MIIMPVPKDIRKFKPKFIGPLTKPQFVSVFIAGIVTATLFTVLGSFVPSNAIMTVAMIIDAVILACGFIELRNLPLLIYLRDIAYRNTFAPARRPYRTENSYQNLSEQPYITYEYFDPDFGYTTNKKGEKVKAKNRAKLSNAKLNEYLADHPDMKGFE